jgi:hypothetical protein
MYRSKKQELCRGSGEEAIAPQIPLEQAVSGSALRYLASPVGGDLQKLPVRMCQ